VIRQLGNVIVPLPGREVSRSCTDPFYGVMDIQVPEPNDVVRIAAGQGVAIGAERHRIDGLVGVAAAGGQRLAERPGERRVGWRGCRWPGRRAAHRRRRAGIARRRPVPQVPADAVVGQAQLGGQVSRDEFPSRASRAKSSYLFSGSVISSATGRSSGRGSSDA
jgi:hypothetical protein